MKRTDWWSSCICLRGAEAPKIEHFPEDAPTLVQIQPPPSLPLGDKLDPEELQQKVTELLDELDLTVSQKNGILNFPPEKQLQLLYSHTMQSSSQKLERPEAYIAKLQEFASLRQPADEYQFTSWLKYTNGLKTALATHSNTFIGEFVEAGGLASLLSFLEAMDESSKEGSMHTNLVACVKALMNNSNGRRHILAHPSCLSIISQSLAVENLKTRTMVLEILGGVCLLPGGHKKVLEAMLHFQKFAGERTRFQTLVSFLDHHTGNFTDLMALKIGAMSFVNAVIRWGPGKDSLEFRLHLRYEFLMLGIQPVLDKLRSLENDVLDTHIDAFEFYRAEDEREWARRFEELHVDTKSASSMFKLLQSKLQYSAAYPHFLSLLHHLLLLMPGDLSSPDHWLLFDRILQQLVTQEVEGSDREISVVDINVKDIVKLLGSERELTENRQKISRLEADNADAITELNNREQKIYQITQEKEVVDRALQQMASQLDSEVKRGEEAEAQKSLLQLQIVQLGEQLEQLASGKQLPDGVTQDIRKSILSSTSALSNGTKTPAPPPPPPPPPNGVLLPPPPPPPLLNGIGPPPPPPQQAFRPPKKIPKSTTQLRAFNWSKLPEARLVGTVFATLDESPLYKALDLEDIDRTFDASSSKKGIEGEKTMERKRTLKATNATVLESRRQQNCAILLSKLKLSNEELIRVLLNMDADGLLAPDMVEQLLKFTPSPEEKAMLEEHSEDIASYTRADRFLFEISKLDHYDERLRCLLYQKKFKERLAESEPKVSAVTSAAKEVAGSKRLKRILELVLALGNYMNKGPRGSAYGFRISSLNKIGDVRATSDRNLTLLHYIVKICSQQWPDLLQLDKDIPTVHAAAKVNLSELQKEINSLSEGLSYIEREIIWHRAQGSAAPKGDRFRMAMAEFSGVAVEKLSSLQTQFKEMNSQFEKVARLFGEDPKSAQPEDLFGTFDVFLEAFKDAQKDLENTRKKEEEEERKKKEVEDRERRAKERKLRMTSSTTNGPLTNGRLQNGGSMDNGPWEQENDFDDLISALRSGDVFGKDIDKMRRKKKHPLEQCNDRERTAGGSLSYC
ncbi:Disheveled-associated activator of morphogenesis 2 [Armadillidium vulgare]|nr:Disheveled-associated activator of morphogenesis 2 [Armadillidium vulgare]